MGERNDRNKRTRGKSSRETDEMRGEERDASDARQELAREEKVTNQNGQFSPSPFNFPLVLVDLVRDLEVFPLDRRFPISSRNEIDSR